MESPTVAEYLATKYEVLIVEASITDLTTIIAQVDAALAARPDVSTAWKYAIADYYFLDQARANFAANFDIRTEDGDSYSLSQQYKDVDSMFKAAYAKVGWIVDPVVVDPETANIGKVTPVTLNYLTPEFETAVDQW